jgi:transposase
VLVDECSTNTSLRPLYAWSLRGERARFKAPRNWGPNVTLLASMTLSSMGPSLAVEGSTTRAVFEAYVEKALIPIMHPGQAVVMNNLSAHQGPRVRQLIEEPGCELIHLPPYSPDFNPIEQAFSKFKGLLHRAEARTREALIEAMGVALSAVTAQDTLGFPGTVATEPQSNYYDRCSRHHYAEREVSVPSHGREGRVRDEPHRRENLRRTGRREARGCKPAMNEEKVAMAQNLLADQSRTMPSVCKILSVSRSSLYRYVQPGCTRPGRARRGCVRAIMSLCTVARGTSL